MAKYRKKALTEFVPYGKGMEDGFEYRPEDLAEARENAHFGLKPPQPYPYIQTLEGKMFISPGDYIGTGIQGEKYPIKPNILTATYEKVEE